MDWTVTLVAISTFIAALAAAGAIWTASTVWRETGLRTRPWVGISGVDVDLSSGTGLIPQDTITISYNNLESLPAVDVEIEVTFVADTSLIEDTEPITVSTWKALGTIFPHELSNERFRFDLGLSPFQARRGTVAVSGSLRYQSGVSEYTTTFEAEARFIDRDLRPPIPWRNRDVT